MITSQLPENLSKGTAYPQREGRLCSVFRICENFKPRFRHKLSLSSNGRVFLIIKIRNLESEVLEYLPSFIADSYDLESLLGLTLGQQSFSTTGLSQTFHIKCKH